MSARRRRQLPKTRSTSSPAWRQIGLAIGRICMVHPEANEEIPLGFTQAKHERERGKKHAPADVDEALAEASRLFRALHPGARRKGRV